MQIYSIPRNYFSTKLLVSNNEHTFYHKLSFTYQNIYDYHKSVTLERKHGFY